MDNEKIPLIFKFYDQNAGNEVDSIYFIGTSQIDQGISSNIIEDYLNKSENGYYVYNLGVGGDDLLRRVTETDYLIESRPKFVVIGISYCDLSPLTKTHEDSLALSPIGINLSTNCRDLFAESNLQILDQTFIERFFYKRKFIFSSIKYSLLNYNNHESGDKYSFRNIKQPAAENKTIKELEESSKDVGWIRWRNVDNETNCQKDALIYLVERLKSNDIGVVIINMPLNPLLSSTIPNSTRDNYFSFINSMDVKFYDLETKYPSSYFKDLVHMNPIGSEIFSRDIAMVLSNIMRRNAN